MDLLYDYRTNPELYPKWQAFLKKHQPKTVIFLGQGDFFLTAAGGESYLNDLSNAEMHRLSSVLARLQIGCVGFSVLQRLPNERTNAARASPIFSGLSS